MDGVKLQDRVDTKYIFGMHQLSAVFREMLNDYRLLEVNGVRGTDYRSLYFDTTELKHFNDHHNRKIFRSKVRFREYLGSDQVYLEVKRKNGRGRTDKKRLKVTAIPTVLSAEQASFIQRSGGGSGEMKATIWNHFTRYTFVNRHKPERLTLDVSLSFSDPSDRKLLENVVVAELKQERMDRTSTFVQIMRNMGLRPCSMSKYCIGMLAVGRPVKHNGFKEVLLKLQRLRQAA